MHRGTNILQSSRAAGSALDNGGNGVNAAKSNTATASIPHRPKDPANYKTNKRHLEDDPIPKPTKTIKSQKGTSARSSATSGGNDEVPIAASRLNKPAFMINTTVYDTKAAGFAYVEASHFSKCCFVVTTDIVEALLTHE